MLHKLAQYLVNNYGVVKNLTDFGLKGRKKFAKMKDELFRYINNADYEKDTESIVHFNINFYLIHFTHKLGVDRSWHIL